MASVGEGGSLGVLRVEGEDTQDTNARVAKELFELRATSRGCFRAVLSRFLQHFYF